MEVYTLITGGHSGIGLGLTKKLLTSGNKLGLIVRNETRKKEFLSQIDMFDSKIINDIDFFYADLSDQKQVWLVAADIKKKWKRIDRLFNNAGIAIMTNERRTSKQGNELQFEINALAPVLLTQELKPLLLKSNNARVISTVTQGLEKLELQTNKIFDETYTSGMKLYSQSKLALLMFMNNMANDESWQKVKFLSIHPGNNKTNMTQSKDNMPALLKLMARISFKNPDFGTQRLYNAGFDKRFANKNGVYLRNDVIIEIKKSLTPKDKETILAAIKP